MRSKANIIIIGLSFTKDVLLSQWCLIDPTAKPKANIITFRLSFTKDDPLSWWRPVDPNYKTKSVNKTKNFLSADPHTAPKCTPNKKDAPPSNGTPTSVQPHNSLHIRISLLIDVGNPELRHQKRGHRLGSLN